MNIEIPFPIFGVNESAAFDKQPPQTSAYMNNVRPFDVLENRARGGQRPGVDKLYTQQIGSTTPILEILDVDYLE